MEITSKVVKMEKDSNLKAMGSVSLTCDLGTITLDGWKIFNGKNGLFVAAPSRPGKEEGKYEDTIRASKDDGLMAEIKQSLLNEYGGTVPATKGKAANSTSEPKTSVPPSYRSSPGPRKAQASTWDEN